ncbi:MAG TPA: hypothetical protein PLF42_13815, partial [Anaerolineales bacterium]|nr:hypothetical protein [Anaerolineales bacterium]
MNSSTTRAAESPGSSLAGPRAYWIFLSALVIFAWIFAGIATSKYGAGVASDSVKYLGVAQSLLDGKGFVNHLGTPLLAWPPLYSMILAGLSLLTGWDVFVSGWYLNVFLNGLNLFLSGVILFRIFRENLLYAYLSNIFILTAIASLRIHATITSDAMYLTLTLGFLIALHGYIKSRSRHAFVWMVIFSALAPMQRYIGMALAVTAVIVFFVENRKNLRLFLRDSLILGTISALPISWWLILRNVMTYGTLFGTGNPTSDFVQNTMLALTKMLHWFAPFHPALMPILTRPWIPLLVIALILLLINKRQHWVNWFNELKESSTYPTLAHGLVYFAAVAATIVTKDHLDLTSNRYYVIMLLPTISLIFITFNSLICPHLKLPVRQAQLALIVIFALWSAYPILALDKYLKNAIQIGEPTNYNYYNGSDFRDTE